MPVLIADDDVISLEMMAIAVAEAGYAVEKVSNGEEAWRQIANGRFRLVVSDWEMPVLNGIDLCRRIRGANLPTYVYVLLVTSHNSAEDIVAGLEAGADDFIAKPFNPAELQVRLRAGTRVLNLETRDLAIFAMAKLAESRDPETGAHLERIQAYCQLLSDYLLHNPTEGVKLTPNFVHTIVLTSPLHDIGKVGIPDCILMKPGRLNRQEFEIMEQHTIIGANTLKAALDQYPTVEFLSMAHEIALCHHERYDGSGYPRGLIGDTIPISARITAIADVYDALTSKRCYKEAFSHLVACNMIIEAAGTHFDPRVVAAFEACSERIYETKIQINATVGEVEGAHATGDSH